MAAKKKSDLELEREYIASISKKRLPKKVVAKKVVPKKTVKRVARKTNPSLAEHAIKDKVHREAILLTERAVKAQNSRMDAIQKQANLSHAEGFIAGAWASKMLTNAERGELINALEDSF